MRKSILIIDDDDIIRQNYRDILEHEGYLVTDYDSVSRLTIASNKRLYDLVLLDISLNADRDAGHRLCESLKLHSPDTPVVMLTSIDDEHNRIMAKSNGADGYWVKSACIDKFLDEVRSLLSERVD